jgi:hypothetical protein
MCHRSVAERAPEATIGVAEYHNVFVMNSPPPSLDKWRSIWAFRETYVVEGVYGSNRVVQLDATDANRVQSMVSRVATVAGRGHRGTCTKCTGQCRRL